MIHKILRGLIIFFGGVIVGLILFRWILIRQTVSRSLEPLPIPTPTDDRQKLSDFSFTERSGKFVGLKDLKGHYWVADFFFTRCQGPCPLLTTTMAKLEKEFPRTDLKFVSFTVDPEYDTTKVLRNYADLYLAPRDRWYFLTGPKDAVYKLIQEGFQLAVEQDEKDPLQVVHSLSMVLVGKEGEVLGHFNTNDPDMLALLRQRLRELPQ